MKKGWGKIKMVDACEILTCGVASTPTYVDKQIGVPFLSAQNVRDGEVVLEKYSFISKEFHQKLTSKNKPSKGDILYSRVGAKYGEAGVVEHSFEFSVYVSVTLIRPKRELLNNYFLKYYLNSPRIKDLAKKSISSSGVPNLNVNSVRDFLVPIPPLPEQKHIVAILDDAFAAIAKAKANAEQNLKNAKELFESYLQGVFGSTDKGWEEKRFEDLCDLITCGVAATPKYVDESEGVPFLSAQNVRDGEVVLDKYRFISKQFHQELTKKNKPSKGDILYSRVGSKFGEAGVVEHDFEFSVYVSLTLIKPKPDELNSYFLKYYLNSPLIKDLAKKSISSSGVPNLNVKEVREFPIKCPSISIQEKIVNEIEVLSLETKKLEAIYQQKINDLEELKKSVLQKAFDGELKTKKQ